MLAVGSDLRGDDAAGLLVAHHLKGLPRFKCPRMKIFLGETAPENLTGEIKKYKPTHLVVIDSADTQGAPGKVAVLELDGEILGTSFCTHALPITIMLRYLLKSIPCQIVILGIQPLSMEFNKPATKSVQLAALRVARHIHQVLAKPH